MHIVGKVGGCHPCHNEGVHHFSLLNVQSVSCEHSHYAPDWNTYSHSLLASDVSSHTRIRFELHSHLRESFLRFKPFSTAVFYFLCFNKVPEMPFLFSYTFSKKLYILWSILQSFDPISCHSNRTAMKRHSWVWGYNVLLLP